MARPKKQPKQRFRECRICKESKPETSEFFYNIKTQASGLDTRCKTCVRKYQEQFKEKRGTFPRTEHGTKLCKKCNEEKSVRKFSANKLQPDGLQVYCKTCVSSYTKEWKERTGYKPIRQPYSPDNPTQREDNPKKWYSYLKSYNREYFHDPVAYGKRTLRGVMRKLINWGLISKPKACEKCNAKGKVSASCDDAFAKLIYTHNAHKKSYYEYNVDAINNNIEWLCHQCIIDKRDADKKKVNKQQPHQTTT